MSEVNNKVPWWCKRIIFTMEQSQFLKGQEIIINYDIDVYCIHTLRIP